MNLRLENAAKGTKAGLIVIFMVLLWLPSLDMFFHWDQTPEVNEKRVLAPFPVFAPRPSGVRDYVSGLEAYYNDRFGFRKRLIYWEQNWKRSWFGESIFHNVIIGRQGWLYYTDEQTGERLNVPQLFTPKQLKEWQSLLECRRDWLAKRNIPYVFVIAPDKQTIYPENLPEWMTGSGSTTKLDQFMAYMKTNSTVEILDLRPALLRARSSERTYQFTDSHWNQYGAFVACQEIVLKLAGKLPGLEPLSMDSFDKKITVESGGNLAQMLAATESMPERDFLTLLPRPPLKALRVIGPDRDKAIDRHTENPDGKGRMIIFGDSFAEGWFPFLGYRFHEVTLYRLYDGHTPLAHVWKTSPIEQERPDVVIDEILENLLGREDPGQIRRLDALK